MKFRKALTMNRMLLSIFFSTVSTLLFNGTIQAQGKLDSLFKVWEEGAPKEKKERVMLMNRIANRLYGSDPDSAFFFADRAYRTSKEIGYEEGMEKGLNVMGIVHYVQSEHDEALKYWERLLKKRRENGDVTGIAKAQNNLGLLYKRLGSYEKALSAHQEALSIRDSLDKTKQIAQSYNNLGILYYDMGEFDKAREHYEQALRLYRKENMSSDVGSALNNLSLVERQKGNYEKALRMGKKALKVDQRAETSWKVANDLMNIGLVFKEMGGLDSAMHYYRKSRSLYREIGSKGGSLAITMNIGALELERGNFQKARELALKAYRKADSISSPRRKKEAAHYVAEASAELGDMKMAYRYQKLHDQWSDTLLTQEKSQQMAKMEAKYESEKRKKELEREKARRRKAELNWQRVLFYSGGGGVILLLAIVLLLVRYLHNKKMNAHLEEQKSEMRQEKEEKELLLKEVNHRVKNNLQLINSLLSLQGKRIEDEELRSLHRDSQDRIRSMGLLHEKIHRSEKWSEEDLEQFVEDLVERMKEAYGMGNEIRTRFRIDASKLDRESVSPLALILNELLSNGMKYAFQGREEGFIEVLLVPEGEEYLLEVTDDGNGFQDEEAKKGGLGLEIVRSLAEQLGGELEIPDVERGAKFRVRFS